MTEKPVEQILGYPVSTAGLDASVEAIASWVTCGDRVRWLACLNPHSYAVALDAPSFSTALREADWLIPDGVGVVLASRVLGGNVRERVTGPDVFGRLHERLNVGEGARIFFIGSTEETLSKIRDRMTADHPNLEVVGTYSPPFKPDYSDSEIDAMVASVNAARPDVLWVGMTAPKQELWVQRVRDRLDVRFVGAVGAVFDFYSGQVKRSSPSFQRLGLEWLPRLLQEPRRLWRRMFVSAPIFLRHVLRQRFRGG